MDSKTNAPRDGNYIPVLIGVSSTTITIGDVDFIAGETPVPIAVDPVTHAVLIEPL